LQLTFIPNFFLKTIQQPETSLVLLQLAPPIFIGLGLVDLLAALWTRQALKSEGHLK
jgi:hypothetical protein